MKENNTFVRYGYRAHRGTLEDSLRTKNYITSNGFERMLKTGKFHLYGYDTRCKQVLWLSESSETWLFIEYETY